MKPTELIQRMQPILEGVLNRLDEERLLSDPAAPFCMDCQEERDAERSAAR